LHNLKPWEEEKVIKKMNDYRTKAGLAVPFDFVLRNTNGTPFYILNDPLTTTPVAIYFQKNSYLTKRLSDLILQMMAGGLIEHWIESESYTISRMKAVNDEPKVMTMENLMAPFILCLTGLALSTVIFILEKIHFCYRGKIVNLLLNSLFVSQSGKKKKVQY
jgi:hypothetical protein